MTSKVVIASAGSGDHQCDLVELAKRFDTNVEKGLTTEQAKKNLEKYGPNRLTPPKTTPEWIKFLRIICFGFNALLWGASGLSFLAYGLDKEDSSNLYLGIVLIITILSTGTFAYYQNVKSSAVMAQFANMLSGSAAVIRDGVEINIEPTEIVPGDVVNIRGGDKVPADVRLVQSSALKVDNSSLTGEAEPQSRSVASSDPVVAESKNMCFMSTMCVLGSGRGVVIATGDKTMIGTIANLASGTTEIETPIGKEIHLFTKKIMVIAVSTGAVFFGIAFKFYSVLQCFIFAITIIVANVPEGLVATVTLCLTHAASVMASKNVLVKNLEAVETLGSTNTICSDKTGTLTQNRMTVVHAYLNGKIWACPTPPRPGSAPIPPDPKFPPYVLADPSFQSLKLVASLCNKGIFKPSEKNMSRFVLDRKCKNGDATEYGLLKFCDPIEDVELVRSKFPKVVEVPFNSINKFQLSVHASTEDPSRPLLLVMKGAPERVIENCTHIATETGKIPMTAEHRQAILSEEGANSVLADMGERVLAFAFSDLDPSTYSKNYVFDAEEMNFPTNNLTFVGLIALVDPPKDAVPQAVLDCKAAGIKVMMVTGDQPKTAVAIARQVNIVDNDAVVCTAFQCHAKCVAGGSNTFRLDKAEAGSGSSAIVIEGRQISGLVEGGETKPFEADDWDRVLHHRQIVFARTTPEQKLQIVSQNQERGGIVAVTGDGVNDSPALKKADIGIAMGISGSEVSREAADMVLLDDDFASIVAGIQEGRLIFDNLKKSIAYTLQHLGPEIIPLMGYVILQYPLPLTTILILCIDLGTDIFPAISLAFEEAESDIMTRPPRDPKVDNLVSARLLFFAYLQMGLIETVATFCTYFASMSFHGYWGSQLFGRAETWLEEGIDEQGFDLEHRKVAQRHAQGATFLCIVLVQMAGLLVCRTHKVSMFTFGFKNKVAAIALGTMIIVSCFIIYVPGVQDVLGPLGLWAVEWTPAMPFMVFIVFYDEVRKHFVRKNPTGMVARLTDY